MPSDHGRYKGRSKWTKKSVVELSSDPAMSSLCSVGCREKVVGCNAQSQLAGERAPII